MVSLSKLLDQGLRDSKCQDVFHPGYNCSEFHYQNTLKYVTTCGKYFLPIIGVPLITKGTNLKKKNFVKGFKVFIEALTTGVLISQSFPMALCGTRAVCGRFNKLNFLYLSTIISTWPIFFTTPRVARFFGTPLFQAALEVILKSGRNPISRAIYQSNAVKTIIFMMCSAFVLHSVQKHGVKVFWMVRAIPSAKQNVCSHEDSCSKSYLKEIGKTLLICIPVDLFKTFSRDLHKKIDLKSVLKNKLLSLDFPTTIFLLSYITIYRVASCLLTRYWKANAELKHIIAACLGGISFRLLPRLAMMCYGVTICLKINWELFNRHKFRDDNKFVKIVKIIPYNKLCTVFAASYLVQVYMMRPQSMNSLGSAMALALTANQAPSLRNAINTHFKILEKVK